MSNLLAFLGACFIGFAMHATITHQSVVSFLLAVIGAALLLAALILRLIGGR